MLPHQVSHPKTTGSRLNICICESRPSKQLSRPISHTSRRITAGSRPKHKIVFYTQRIASSTHGLVVPRHRVVFSNSSVSHRITQVVASLHRICPIITEASRLVTHGSRPFLTDSSPNAQGNLLTHSDVNTTHVVKAPTQQVAAPIRAQ